jgi:hypothetical protein
VKKGVANKKPGRPLGKPIVGFILHLPTSISLGLHNQAQVMSQCLNFPKDHVYVYLSCEGLCCLANASATNAARGGACVSSYTVLYRKWDCVPETCVVRSIEWQL